MPRRFCSFHRTPSKDEKEVWLLQRDITYALILPVIEIYRYASQLARSMLGNRNIFDLELVFRGDARGAFSWLQCFIVEEKDWCSTRGCPGEPHIAVVLIRLLTEYSVCCQLRPTSGTYHPDGLVGLSPIPITKTINWRPRSRSGFLAIVFAKSAG